MAKKLKKSIILPIFISIFLVFSALILVGCGKGDVKPTAIKFATEDIRLFLGQTMTISYELTPEDADAYITLSTDNPDVVGISAGGRIEGLKYGTAKLRLAIRDTELYDECNVVVDDGVVLSLNLDYSRTKTQYFLGEEILPENIAITAIAKFETGVQKVIQQKDLTISYPPVADEESVITVTYLEATETIPIEILDNTAEVAITTPPNSTNVYIGESFDPTGMVITKTFRNGDSEIVTDYTYDEEPVTLDTTFINIYCEGFEPIRLTIRVCAKKAVRQFDELQAAVGEQVESIEILSEMRTPTPLQLSYNESLTIFSRPSTLKLGIAGTGESSPIKIEGSFIRLTFIGLTFSSTSENIIDLSECESGIIVFQNVTFECARDKVIAAYENSNITVIFEPNCTFLSEN